MEQKGNFGVNWRDEETFIYSIVGLINKKENKMKKKTLLFHSY
jgi:hypothetical protein